jgi:hypothetical protein
LRAVIGERRDEMKKPPKPEDRYRKHVTVTVRPPRKDLGGRYCQVDPSVFRVRYGGTVTFRVEEGCGPLDLFVPTPKGAPRPLAELRAPLVVVPRTKEGRAFTVPRGSGRREYPYAVYCRACNCFGKGSVPKMITGP